MTADDRYKGMDGGLYGGGKNTPPPDLQKAVDAVLPQIAPLDADGKASPNGKVVLLSIGMSNTTQEFSTFKRLADADPAKSPALVIVDGAQGAQEATRWDDDTAKPQPWQTAEQRLKVAGVTPAQVEVVWLKQARHGPADVGPWPKHADEMRPRLVACLNIARRRLPNLRIVYLSSRIYAGYAVSALNPEPYAYEGAFVMRSLIQNQMKGDPQLNWDPAKGEVKAPLLLWGPYLWADGTTPRKSDGLIYNREDLGPDGTHPSPNSGAPTVARLLLDFLKTNPNARGWFLKPEPAAAGM
jgi:hypothetical protein